MIPKTWRRILLLSFATVLLLLPAAQAAPRAARADIGTVDRLAEPAQWLNRFWETVTGLWKSATAADQTTGTGGGGGETGGGTTANGDAGASIDPDGHHG